MNTIELHDIDIYEVGTQITMCGVIYHSNDRVYLVPFPDQDFDELHDMPASVLAMDAAQWERFLQQSDVLDVRGPNKAILRKSQRQIDKIVSWKVFERDQYVCRYCGRRAPLTVDHVVTWESGGSSVESNLVAVCGPCNKKRGMLEYSAWLKSPAYIKASSGLSEWAKDANQLVLVDLPRLRREAVQKPRSR